MVKIALISGSLRKDSLSTKIAKNVGELFPSGYEAQFVEIGNLPMYNEDIRYGNQYSRRIYDIPKRH